ncbi:ATPase, T2SS/T4P/T4SS family [Niallia taxi]|uniref:ATPase, T2SS/T4P/T4SS family n=1 Tax=Niallia taxi TaxID=2499688 RepID=UPI0015F5FD9C|nr:ATPase, T2SS/T4P/T4SS family [Niallia taxi]
MAVSLKERKIRQDFSVIEHLKEVGKITQATNTVETTSISKGYQIRDLSEIVKIVQDELKAYESGTEDEQDEHKEAIHEAGLGNPVAQEKIKAIIKKIINEKRLHATSGQLLDSMSLADAVFALSIGAGLIEDLYRSKDVEEVQVNDTSIYVMKDGVAQLHPRRFETTEQVIRLQERLALYGRKRISEQNPIVSTNMWNRSRLTMTQPNYSAFPTITIRNFIMKDPSLDTLIEKGTINKDMSELLKLMVKYHASMIVAGPTKSGKTTTLYSLAKEIDPTERVLTLETEFEMMLHERLEGNRNIIPFQAVPELGITMEEAFKPLLRNSPDRILVGEIRGSEASQAVNAALRGHDTMITVHSKYRNMLVTDMMDMIKQDGRSHDDTMLKNRIGRAFNVVVYQRLVKENEYQARRVMTEITEIRPLENGDIETVPLFIWNARTNEWEKTGNKVSDELMEHFISYGATPAEFEKLGVY